MFSRVFKTLLGTKAVPLAEPNARPSCRKATRGSSASRRPNLAPEGFITPNEECAILLKSGPVDGIAPPKQQNAHRGEARSPEFRIRRQGGFIAVPRWRRNRRRDTLTSRKSFRKMASCTARRGTSARHVGKKCRENADLSDGSSVEPFVSFFRSGTIVYICIDDVCVCTSIKIEHPCASSSVLPDGVNTYLVERKHLDDQ